MSNFIHQEGIVWQDVVMSDRIIDVVVQCLDEAGKNIAEWQVLEVLNMAAPAIAAAITAFMEASTAALFCDGDVRSHFSGECEHCYCQGEGDDPEGDYEAV